MKRLFAAAAAALLVAGSAGAAEVKPAVVYDLGGKFDKSFNEGVYNGAAKFSADTGIEFREFEVQTDSQRVQALRNFARRGQDPILAVGFQYASAMDKVAPEFPDTRFAIIDSVVDHPNVQSIVFREHEGSFIVGVLAAMAAPGGKVGFVGGMDVPLIRRFACGYVLGARHARPDVQVFQNMTGTTGAAWNDPVKGGELAKSQFDRGAEVVYHAAGSTGLGVLQAAADAGKLGHRGRLQPEPPPSRARAHLHAEAGRRRGLRRLRLGAPRRVAVGRARPRARGERGGVGARRAQRGTGDAGHEGRRGGGRQADRRRRDQGPRLRQRGRLPREVGQAFPSAGSAGE